MHPAAPLAAATALLALAAAHPARAELTSLFSTNVILYEASIENEGLADAFLLQNQLFPLHTLGAMPLETRSAIAVISTGSAHANLAAQGALARTADSFTLDFDAATDATLEAHANDTFSFLHARVANLTRFTTTEHARLTLTANAALSFDLHNTGLPLIPQTIIELVNELDPTPLLYQNTNFTGPLHIAIDLPPGQYQLRLAADSAFQTFGFPANLYTADSALTLTAAFTTIPAPHTAALIPLAYALSSHRRR